MRFVPASHEVCFKSHPSVLNTKYFELPCSQVRIKSWMQKKVPRKLPSATKFNVQRIIYHLFEVILIVFCLKVSFVAAETICSHSWDTSAHFFFFFTKITIWVGGDKCRVFLLLLLLCLGSILSRLHLPNPTPSVGKLRLYCGKLQLWRESWIKGTDATLPSSQSPRRARLTQTACTC